MAIRIEDICEKLGALEGNLMQLQRDARELGRSIVEGGVTSDPVNLANPKPMEDTPADRPRYTQQAGRATRTTPGPEARDNILAAGAAIAPLSMLGGAAFQATELLQRAVRDVVRAPFPVNAADWDAIVAISEAASTLSAVREKSLNQGKG
jgi:hypothetical protein